MTKKDYIMLARAIKSNSDRYNKAGDTTASNILACMVQEIAGELQRDNARFNSDKFLVACGLITE